MKIALLLSAVLISAVAHARTPEQIFEDSSRSLVVIHAFGKDEKPTNQGSGVVIGAEAVVTNCHVLEDAATLSVLYQSESTSRS